MGITPVLNLHFDHQEGFDTLYLYSCWIYLLQTLIPQFKGVELRTEILRT